MVKKILKQIKPVIKKALIKNITFGVLSDKGFYLGVNETKEVDYTNIIKNYAGKKLIKILKIY